MDNLNIDGRVIAVLAADGYAAEGLAEPRLALEAGGAAVHILSPTGGSGGRVLARGQVNERQGVPSDVPVKTAVSTDYDGLWIPGGAESAETLRADTDVLHLVQSFFDNRKPIVAVAEGISVLLNAGVTGGRELSGRNGSLAGGADTPPVWVDEDSAVDGVLMTARSTRGIPPILAQFIDTISKTPLPPARQSTSAPESSIQTGDINQGGLPSA